MSNKGYGDEYVKRYKMVTAFHQQRRPLIILLCGAPCTGQQPTAARSAAGVGARADSCTQACLVLPRQFCPVADSVCSSCCLLKSSMEMLWQRSDVLSAMHRSVCCGAGPLLLDRCLPPQT